jgi:Family of unknown function (DUF5694)
LWILQLLALPLPAAECAFQAHAQRSDSVCAAGRSPLLIVGTYHMANTHKDSFNLNADDVLSDRRQREIDALVGKLARFKPTIVAVEAPYIDTTTAVRYRNYRAGAYTLGRNEIEQVGFRLAARLNLPTVSTVDYPMYMSGQTPAELAPRRNQSDSGRAPEPAVLTSADSLLRALTVTEYYKRINSDSSVRKDHSGYLDLLLPDTASPGLYAGADLLTNWYKRNFRIFANLNRVTRFGRDRVLLVIGSGHRTILDQLADAAPYYCRENVEDYLR